MTKDRSHTQHRFTRQISTAGDGRAVFACAANPYCVETEIRRPQEPSPFAVKSGRQKEARDGSTTPRK